MPNNDEIETIFELLCPAIKHAKCIHRREDGKWNFWRADSGLCWCNGCGKCLNGRWEYESGFSG